MDILELKKEVDAAGRAAAKATAKHTSLLKKLRRTCPHNFNDIQIMYEPFEDEYGKRIPSNDYVVVECVCCGTRTYSVRYEFEKFDEADVIQLVRNAA